MHMIIRAIVYAKDGIEALEKAKVLFKSMCGEEHHPFDYYRTFDNEGTPVSGKGRWGDVPTVARADSSKGKQLIAEGWEAQVEEFNHNLRRVRKQIFLPRKKLMNSRKKVSLWRYYTSCLYDEVGPHIYLYDNDGAAIGDEDHLKDALNKWECLYEDVGLDNPYHGLKVFVVPTDIHF